MKSKYLFIYNIVRLLMPETGLFRLKSFLLKVCGVNIGRNVQICSSAKIIGNGKLSVGKSTWLGQDVFILSAGDASINIGNNVDIAPKVFMGTGTHELYSDDTRIAGVGFNKDISIGDGTWVGANATILPGVNIGEMCMIAAGSLVNKDVPANTMVGGVPAKFIKFINGN